MLRQGAAKRPGLQFANAYGWMRPPPVMIEPTVSLALTLESNPGVYACLLGSGVSATSGIPTGWGIVVDLIKRVARSVGEDPGDDPAGWYEARYGEEPNYSKLLDEVARTPAERELDLARRWYDEQRYGLGLVFFVAFEAAVEHA